MALIAAGHRRGVPYHVPPPWRRVRLYRDGECGGALVQDAKTWVLVEPEPEEPQICVQLFGTKPEQFAYAVDAVQERVGDKLSLIDINMACPARKVITKGEGSRS